MNRELTITRRLAIIAMLLASALLVFACYMVGLRSELDRQPNVPANTVVVPVSDGDFSQNTTSPPPETTTVPVTTTAPPPPPVDLTVRQECSGRLTVKTPTANVRTDADKDATLVAVINEGESYDVIAQKCSSTGILWFEIRIGDTTGYVAGSYVNYDGPIVGGRAYLTFDDGPTANTLRILDILDQYDVKATFFVIYHGGQEDTYRAIVERGHTIALHSYSHNYSSIYTSSQAFFDDLKRLDDHVFAATGVHSRIIRFPGGTSNSISAKYCKGVMTDIAARADREGYFYFDWNVDSGDAEDVTVPADIILRNIRNNIGSQRHAVVLLHDASAKTTTVDALPGIIEYLLGRGYELLPLREDTTPVRHTLNN